MDIFPVLYLGPLDYYQQLIQQESIVFEQHENFTKQTYRNRCVVLGSNGKTNLSIPIQKTASKIPMKELKISYQEAWQKDHWRAIVSAYQNSPFFEYYDYLFQPFYEKEETFLIDFNLGLHEVILKCLDTNCSHVLSASFSPMHTENEHRLAYSPKKESAFVKTFAEYNQVFSDRMEFTPNLSIIDLIFNEGPNSRIYLKNKL